MRRRSCDTGASLRRWQHTGGVAAVYKGWRDATRQSGSRFYQPHKVSFPPLSTSSHPLPLTSSHCCHYIVAVIIIKPHNVLFQTLKYIRRFHKTILPLLLDDTKNVVHSKFNASFTALVKILKQVNKSQLIPSIWIFKIPKI